jgi:hypothetical protein
MFNKLTVRLPDEPIYIPDENKWSVTDEFGAKCLIGEVVDRLAAYEDSGLSPEEVQELAKAKADGRLVVLPCKVGTRVWVIGQDCDLCHDMYTEEPCLFGDCEYRKVIESVFLPSMTDEFGKTVFLTREDAEKAIAEVRE